MSFENIWSLIKVFGNFKFSLFFFEVFGCVWNPADPFEPARTHSVTFGCIRNQRIVLVGRSELSCLEGTNSLGWKEPNVLLRKQNAFYLERASCLARKENILLTMLGKNELSCFERTTCLVCLALKDELSCLESTNCLVWKAGFYFMGDS